jgi:hypothetical protein
MLLNALLKLQRKLLREPRKQLKNKPKMLKLSMLEMRNGRSSLLISLQTNKATPQHGTSKPTLQVMPQLKLLL